VVFVLDLPRTPPKKLTALPRPLAGLAGSNSQVHSREGEKRKDLERDKWKGGEELKRLDGRDRKGREMVGNGGEERPLPHEVLDAPLSPD